MGKDSEKGQYASPDGSAFWEYVSAASCALLVLGIGAVAGWNSPTTAQLMASDSPIPIGNVEASTLAGVVSLGHTIAPPLTMLLVDKFGRKHTLLMAALPMAVGWGMITVAHHVVVLYIARFISGLSIGLTFCVSPMYLGEIASVKLRGAISMLVAVVFNLGILFMFLLAPSVSMRVAASICFGIVLLFLISLMFIPDSPYFLVMVGKDEEAEASLEKLRGKADVSEELELIKRTVHEKKRASSTVSAKELSDFGKKPSAFKLLYSVAGNRRAMFVVLLYAILHHYCGFVSFLVFGHVIFKDMGTDIPIDVCTVLIAGLQLSTGLATTFVVDKLGRRPLSFVSGAISSTCLLVIGSYFYMLEYLDVNAIPYSTIPFAASIVLTIALNFGLIPLQYVVTSEIFGTDVKALGNCIIIVGSGFMGTLGTKGYLLIAKTWGYGHSVVFFFFSMVVAVATCLLMWKLPETKGKTLLQIQQELKA